MNMVELRVNISAETMQVIDAYCSANGVHRNNVTEEVLGEWARQKIHESILICRVSGINPNAVDKHGKPKEIK